MLTKMASTVSRSAFSSMLRLSRLRLHAALRLPCRHCAALRHECVWQRCRQGLRRRLPSTGCLFSPDSHQMPQHMRLCFRADWLLALPRARPAALGHRGGQVSAGKAEAFCDDGRYMEANIQQADHWFRLNGLSGRIWLWRMVVPIRLLWAVVAGVKRYGPFCIPKAAILENETGRMGTQNGPFCNGVEKRPWRQADVGTACRWR